MFVFIRLASSADEIGKMCKNIKLQHRRTRIPFIRNYFRYFFLSEYPVPKDNNTNYIWNGNASFRVLMTVHPRNLLRHFSGFTFTKWKSDRVTNSTFWESSHLNLARIFRVATTNIITIRAARRRIITTKLKRTPRKHLVNEEIFPESNW